MPKSQKPCRNSWYIQKCFCVYISLILLNYYLIIRICHSKINLLIVWYKDSSTYLNFFYCNSWHLFPFPFELVRVLDFRLKWGCEIFSLKSTSRYRNEKPKFETKRVKDIRFKLAPPSAPTGSPSRECRQGPLVFVRCSGQARNPKAQPKKARTRHSRPEARSLYA